MPQAQQRTRNRRRIDPGQAPLPVLYPCLGARINADGSVSFTFGSPLRLEGIPAVLDEDGNPPLAAEMTTETELTLTWEFTPQGTARVTFPDWTPALRGLNGEWVSGGIILLGLGEDGQMPAVALVNSVTALGGSVARWDLSADWTVDAPFPGTIGARAVVSTVQLDNNSLEVTYDGAVAAGNQWNVNAWTFGSFSAETGTWIAPGVGRVV